MRAVKPIGLGQPYLVFGRVVVHEGCEASLCGELHRCGGRQEAFIYLQRNALVCTM